MFGRKRKTIGIMLEQYRVHGATLVLLVLLVLRVPKAISARLVLKV